MDFNHEEFLEEFRKNSSLETLISIDKVQLIQDSMADTFGCGAIFISPEGKEITKPSHFNRSLLKDYIIVKQLENTHESIEMYVGAACQVAIVPISIEGKLFGKYVLHLDEEEAFAKKLDKCATLLHSIMQFTIESQFSAYEHRSRLEWRRKMDEVLEHKNEELKHKNDFDELTGLYSRSYFNEQCSKMEKAEEPLLCVAVGDVNNLKITNDLFGHRHGDYLLTTIAKVMMEEANEEYVVARCGGDEINVLMPKALRRDAEWYCHRVRKRLAEITDCCTTPSISLGVGKRSEFAQSIKETINIADMKMYRSKVDFKNHLNITDDIYNLLLRRGVLTQNYVAQVEELGVGFCNYLSSDETTIQQMKLLSWMHELGATILNDNVYFKDPSERTLIERREVHKHSDIGARIAMLSSHTEPVADVILQLHERWDGRGYPRELEGSQIRPLARILQVVTEYCRMIEDSRMGLHLSPEEAKQMLLENAGTQFDPGMVNVFIKYLKSIGK